MKRQLTYELVKTEEEAKAFLNSNHDICAEVIRHIKQVMAVLMDGLFGINGKV